MKIVFEDIKRLAGSSFRILVNPKLNDFYYWHFHPEFELTFIEAPQGTRRVGNHVGQFEGSDLVFIGSNIPHLNFDYGIRTEYKKVVLQIKEDFFKNVLCYDYFTPKSSFTFAFKASPLKSFATIFPFASKIKVAGIDCTLYCLAIGSLHCSRFET